MSRSSVLGLDGSKGGLVGSTNSRKAELVLGRVGSHGGKGDIRVNLVKKSKVCLRELAGTGETGKEWSISVASSKIQAGKSRLSREGVGSVTSRLDSRGKGKASTGAELGHLSNVKDTSSIEASTCVVNEDIRSLVSLEGKLDTGGNLQGGFQHSSTVGSGLGLVDIELGVCELGSNLGGKGSSLTSLRLDGDSYGTSILLALESGLGGVVVVQKVCRRETAIIARTSTISKMRTR